MTPAGSDTRWIASPGGASAVARGRGSVPLGHCLAQVCRCDHFYLSTVAQDVHDQFGLVGVGHGQGLTAICFPVALLARMPLLTSHPAGGGRGETQHGLAGAGAGKDAVAGA